MKRHYYYYAVDEFGDKMRRFLSRMEASYFISKRPGWTLLREEYIIKPIIDWNNFEEAPF